MYGTVHAREPGEPASARPCDQRAGRPGNLRGTPGMHGRGQSDGPVVPANPPNNAAATAGAAEVGEERGPAKGNTDRAARPVHTSGQRVPPPLDVRGWCR